MAVSPEKGIEQSEQQAVPQCKAPAERETANTEHGDDFVGGRRTHDFSIHHTQPSPPEEQFVNEEQKEGREQHSGFPMVDGGLIKPEFS